MSPVDQQLVERKLQRIAENLTELEKVHRQGWNHYQSTKLVRKGTEKYIQETVEAASDINSHILVEKGLGVPEDYYQGFIKLGEGRVIPFDLAQEIAPAAGLRNRIVHDYEKLDDRKVFDSIEKMFEIFPKYIQAVRNSLKMEMGT